MPELGQMAFGNKWEEHDCPRYVEDGIYHLAEAIGGYDPHDMHRDGHEFDNAVFEMHPYWWGDCECGFEQAEIAWAEVNRHAEDCYQTELEYRQEHLAGRDYLDVAPQLAKEWGLPYQGCAVHCTCTHDAEYQAWRLDHDHDPTCPIVLPNFRHKPTGFSVHWYKYMGRSQTMDREMSPQEWRRILRECEDSLEGADP